MTISCLRVLMFSMMWSNILVDRVLGSYPWILGTELPLPEIIEVVSNSSISP